MFKSLSVAVALSLVIASASAKQLLFVTPQQSQAASILLDPPKDGSSEQQSELAALHALEASRSKAQVEAARADAEGKSIFLFRTVFGEAFKPENLPLSAALGEKIARVASENVQAAKTRFQRLHPYTFDPTLRPVCKSKGEPESYPSGHALLGWMLGLTLVEMVPEKREEILLRAQDYAHNRLVCGVHYPSDIAASQPLAYAIHALMTQNPDYAAELAAARAELRKLLALPE